MAAETSGFILPKAAESEGAKYLPKEQPSAALVEVEDRYTAFDNNTATMQEGDTSYVEFKATAEGSKIAVQNLSYADRTNSRLIGLKFRTNGPATLELSKGYKFNAILYVDAAGYEGSVEIYNL